MCVTGCDEFAARNVYYHFLYLPCLLEGHLVQQRTPLCIYSVWMFAESVFGGEYQKLYLKTDFFVEVGLQPSHPPKQQELAAGLMVFKLTE